MKKLIQLVRAFLALFRRDAAAPVYCDSCGDLVPDPFGVIAPPNCDRCTLGGAP